MSQMSLEVLRELRKTVTSDNKKFQAINSQIERLEAEEKAAKQAAKEAAKAKEKHAEVKENDGKERKAARN